jgi:hypothetical protein
MPQRRCDWLPQLCRFGRVPLPLGNMVALDKLPVHKNGAMREIIGAVRALLLYLPPAL